MQTLEEISRQKLLAAAASYNPANNPSAPSTVARGRAGGAVAPALAPLASPVQMTRTGRGGIPMPVVGQDVPGPRFRQGPAGSGGGGRGRNPGTSVVPGSSLIQDANAKSVRASTNPVAVTSPVPLSQPQVAVASGSQPLAPTPNVQRNYGTQQGITKITNPNMPGEAPLFTNIQDTGEAVRGGGANIVPGLFSGVSSETEQALFAARQAAADRGDFAAVDNSYRTPEQKDEFTAQQAQNRLLRNIGKLPPEQLPQALAAVGGLQGQSQEAALGQQKLQSGAIDLSNKEHVQGALDALLNADPKDPAAQQQAQTLLQTILAAQPGYKPAAQQRQFTSEDIPTGSVDELGQPITEPRPFNQMTGAYGPSPVPLGGAQQVAAPPAAIAKLQQNPQLAADFKQKYGYLPPGF